MKTVCFQLPGKCPLVQARRPLAGGIADSSLPLAVRYPANVRPCKHGGHLPGISRSDRAAPFPIRSARYREQLTALPLAVRYPANVHPCKHGGHLPGISRKKAANLFQTYCLHWPPVGGWYSVFGLISQKGKLDILPPDCLLSTSPKPFSIRKRQMQKKG